MEQKLKSTIKAYAIVFGIVFLALGWYLYKNLISASIITTATEICDNGIDDNGNGLRDECWDPGNNYQITGKTYYISAAGSDSNPGTHAG